MPFEAKAAEPFDPRKLASYDASRVPISVELRADDPRFFPDFSKWKQEPVEVSVGARTVKVRSEVFKHASHVPLDTQVLNVVGAAYGKSPEGAPVLTNTPKPVEAPANALLSLFAIPLGLGTLGGAVGFATHPGERWKYARRGAVSGLGAGIVIDTTACSTPSTAPAEVTQVPAEVTPIVPATVENATNTPPPGFQTETPVAPSDIIGSHPDYKDASVGGVAFTHGATEAQLADSTNPLRLPEYAVGAYSENIKAIQAKVEGEQSAQVFWNSTYDRNFVLLTRVESGVTQVAVIAAGEGNFSYHPNAEWFDFTATESPAYTWVALPAGVSAADLVGGYYGDYPVWGIQKPSETIPSQLFVPGAEHGFEQNPAKPVEVAKFSIDSLGLTPDVATALKKHAGLEESIKEGADGFTTTITYWNADHTLVTEEIGVNPAVMTENIQSTNNLGDTPVMLTSEGQKLYWSQEHKGWFKVEMSPDINNPVFIPYEYLDVATRAIIVEFNQPFSQAAMDRWNKYPGLIIDFQYLTVNANTGEGTRFAALGNRSTTEAGLTPDNGEVQVLDAWFNVGMPDGSIYESYPTKWLDPLNPKSPKGTDWKVIWNANGQEIMGDPANRAKFDALLALVGQNGSRLVVAPVVAAEKNFFNDTNGLITFGTAQPSLAKLLTLSGNQLGPLALPNRPTDTFGNWIKQDFGIIGPENTSIGFAFNTNQDADYLKNFLPADVQTMLFPSLVITR